MSFCTLHGLWSTFTIPVTWLWTGEKRLGKLNDKYPVRDLSLYEEFDSSVQSQVFKLLLSALKK
jgi:hypothetical protein